MSRFCPKCGNPVPENARFCGACGTPFSAPAPIQEIHPAQPLQPNPPQVTAIPSQELPVAGFAQADECPPQKNKKKWWIILVSLVVAVAITLGAVLVPELLQNADQSDNAVGTSDPSGVNVDPTQVTRTIMIYIVGSNLESLYGAATDDITEMVEAQYDLTKVNVLLCAGGANEWQNETMDANETSYFQVTEDDVVEVISNPQMNMGSSDTLCAFLNYCATNYAAQRYSLILWDHGGGPILGYGDDELSRDSMLLSELQAALKNSPFTGNNKLELLGFDACLMGTIETAWALKDYAQYFVASQETEPGQGWDYGFLSQLNQCHNGGEIGQKIIDSYFDYYQQLYAQSPSQESEITLSCLDLSQIDKVEQSLDQLFANVNKDVLAGQLGAVSRCRYSTKAFGKYASDTGYDLVDLKHMLSLLSSHYSQATEVVSSLSDLVVYTRANVSNANGVSIYHPYDLMQEAGQWIRTLSGLGFADHYVDYLDNFVAGMNHNATVSVGYYQNFSKTKGQSVTSGQQHDLSIQLTPEQQQTFSAAEYYVFYEMPAEATFSKSVEYLQVFSGQDVTLSADGKLSATYGGKAVYGKNHKTGKYSDCPLSMNQIYDGTLEEKYYFPCMFWELKNGFDLLPVNWLMKIKNGVPVLLNAYDMVADEETTFPDKYLINSADYNVYTFANNSYKVASDGNGNTQFTFTGSSYGFEYDRDEGFSIELRDIPDKSQYRAVFIIEDIYGNRYFSDFIPLQQ